MYGDLLRTDDTKAKPIPQNALGKIKDESMSHFNEEFEVWVHWSPEFIDPLSVPKEYRASILGRYAEFPEDAIDDFIEDVMPAAKRLRKAQEALMWEWDRIQVSKKKKFLKHYKKTFGLDSILMGPGGMMNLAMMFLMLGADEDFDDENDDELATLFLLMLLMGMENKGPDLFQEELKALLHSNEAFQNGLNTLTAYSNAGLSIEEIQFELEKKLEQNQVLKFRSDF